jgi:hypothetical protein
MKLGYMMLLVAVGAMLVIAPSAMGAKADKGDKGHGDMGKVTAKADDGTSITITGKDKAEKKIIVNATDTKVKIASKGADGTKEEKDGTLADVTVGSIVAVTAEEGKPATKIVVLPAGGDHKKK